MCNLLCQKSRVRFLGFNSVWFYLKSLVGSPSYLLWVPEARVAEVREDVLQPAIQHFAYYAFAAGEREDLLHSRFSLACVESVSFVGKVETKAKICGREGGKRNPLLPSYFFHFFGLTLTFAQELGWKRLLRSDFYAVPPETNTSRRR